jgi:catechol 2,3-dioxygenase-like lactoylglutathione lyase family enzyme
MIGYVTVGVSDMDRAKGFYEALLPTVGGHMLMGDDHYVFFGTGMDKPMLTLARPHNGEPQSVGNGMMVALAAPTRAAVDAAHAKALALGGACEGEPGLRGPEAMGFYGAYFRDLDGNKLCAYRMGPAD